MRCDVIVVPNYSWMNRNVEMMEMDGQFDGANEWVMVSDRTHQMSIRERNEIMNKSNETA